MAGKCTCDLKFCHKKTTFVMKKHQRVAFMGSVGVGKSCIITRMIEGCYYSDSKSTIGANYQPLKHLRNGVEMEVDIWDTAGNEKYRTLLPLYYREAKVIVIVFSLIEQSSLDELENWHKMCLSNTMEGVKFIFVGNKLDIKENRIDENEIESKVGPLGGIYIEVSAKTGDNIDQLINRIFDFIDSDSENTNLNLIEHIDNKPNKKNWC